MPTPSLGESTVFMVPKTKVVRDVVCTYRQACCTNPTMYQSHNPTMHHFECTFLLESGDLLDISLMHYGLSIDKRPK